MPRVGTCRLSQEGVIAMQQEYVRGRWANVTAFCDHAGVSRSTYFELTKRSKWFEKATIEDKLASMGIPDFSDEKYYEFRENQPQSLHNPSHNLPSPTSSFVGRTRETADVK